MTDLLRLCIEFFQAGLFAVGGGLATLPFLYSIGSETGWYTAGDVANMVAISESTPGPIGINMSTYVGYRVQGVLGAVITPIALVLPSVLVALIISKALDRFKASTLVRDIFYGLRPASTGLILAAGLGVARITFLNLSAETAMSGMLSVFNLKAIGLAAVIFLITWKRKLHPILLIIASAIVGIVLEF